MFNIPFQVVPPFYYNPSSSDPHQGECPPHDLLPASAPYHYASVAAPSAAAFMPPFHPDSWAQPFSTVNSAAESVGSVYCVVQPAHFMPPPSLSGFIPSDNFYLYPPSQPSGLIGNPQDVSMPFEVLEAPSQQPLSLQNAEAEATSCKAKQYTVRFKILLDESCKNKYLFSVVSEDEVDKLARQNLGSLVDYRLAASSLKKRDIKKLTRPKQHITYIYTLRKPRIIAMAGPEVPHCEAVDTLRDLTKNSINQAVTLTLHLSRKTDQQISLELKEGRDGLSFRDITNLRQGSAV